MKTHKMPIDSKSTLSMQVQKVGKLCNGPLDLPAAKSLGIRVIRVGSLESY